MSDLKRYEPQWLTWAKELQALAQTGLAYTKDVYDIERFNRIRDISVEILHTYTSIEHQTIQQLFCDDDGYQTPKIDVRGAVFLDGRILLVKEKIDGCWSMPGGWADPHLSEAENVVKEVQEESGLKVKPNKLVAILDRKKHHTSFSPYGIYKIFILCDLIEGTFKDNIETSASQFFELKELPKLSEGRVNRQQIEMCYWAWQDSGWDVIFD